MLEARVRRVADARAQQQQKRLVGTATFGTLGTKLNARDQLVLLAEKRRLDEAKANELEKALPKNVNTIREILEGGEEGAGEEGG